MRKSRAAKLADVEARGRGRDYTKARIRKMLLVETESPCGVIFIWLEMNKINEDFLF